MASWQREPSRRSQARERRDTVSAVRRHPLITFFVLTYLLAWILWLPLVILRDTIPAPQGLVLALLGSAVPSLLGIVLTAIVLGRGSLRKLLGRLLIWRVDPPGIWW